MRLVRTPVLPAAPTQVVSFSDVHFDPFYEPQTFGALVAAPAEEWESIFERSTVTTVSTWSDETQYPLLVKALAAVGARSASSSFLFFGGDMLAHSLPIATGQPTGAGSRRWRSRRSSTA